MITKERTVPFYFDKSEARDSHSRNGKESHPYRYILLVNCTFLDVCDDIICGKSPLVLVRAVMNSTRHHVTKYTICNQMCLKCFPPSRGGWHYRRNAVQLVRAVTVRWNLRCCRFSSSSRYQPCPELFPEH